MPCILHHLIPGTSGVSSEKSAAEAPTANRPFYLGMCVFIFLLFPKFPVDRKEVSMIFI